MPVQAPNTTLQRSSHYSTSARQRTDSMHWLFRSNIPRHRTSMLPADINKRNFFGMGEIIGVLTNASYPPSRHPR